MKTVIENYRIGMVDYQNIYDDVDTITLYMLTAQDSVGLKDEFEKVLDFHDLSVAHHEELLAL